MSDTSARETVRAYYQALRAGDRLPPYFAAADADGPLVKFGISETLRGSDAVETGLREQTASTTDWAVESTALAVSQREGVAWFADEVLLAWTDTAANRRHEFDTRWSGTLERRPDAEDGAPGEWRFVGMHVSVAGDL